MIVHDDKVLELPDVRTLLSKILNKNVTQERVEQVATENFVTGAIHSETSDLTQSPKKFRSRRRYRHSGRGRRRNEPGLTGTGRTASNER